MLRTFTGFELRPAVCRPLSHCFPRQRGSRTRRRKPVSHKGVDEGERQCERPGYHPLETVNVQAKSQIRTTHRGSEEIAQVSSGAGERASIVRSEKSGTSCETQRPFRTRAPEKVRQSSKKTKLKDYE